MAAMTTENLARLLQRQQLGSHGALHRRTRKLSHAVLATIHERTGWRSQSDMRHVVLESLTCTDDTTYYLENESGQHIPPFQVAYASQTQNSHLLAAVDEEGVVSIIDTKQTSAMTQQSVNGGVYQTAKTKWTAHSNAIFDVVWSNNDKSLLTAAGDMIVSAWDVETHRELFSLQGHHMSVKCIRQNPLSEHLYASGSRDGSVLLWDTRASLKAVGCLPDVHCSMSPQFTSPAGSRKRRKMGSTAPRSVTCLEYAGNGYELVTAGATDGVVKFWDLRRCLASQKSKRTKSSTAPTPLRSLVCSSRAGVNHGITSLAFNNTRTKLLVNVLNDDMKMFDYERAVNGETQASASFTGHLSTSFYGRSGFSPDGDCIIGGSSDGAVMVWRATERGESILPTYALKGHTGEVNGVAWNSNDSTELASCSDDGTVRVWKVNRQASEVDREAAPFVLERNARDWANWSEFQKQPEGRAYKVAGTPKYETPVKVAQSPQIIHRNKAVLSGQKRERSSPRKRALAPRTLMDFWKVEAQR
ncbi:TPA: hypothetical protein N0F65_005639 [Lagenidium giganteum]|uniref:Uncharacterized protein n=1 Tax=Lagenidium giganteum TaxID=4803 RepID=A0AAV2YXP6_9STRA|nr:TPA: hypothetical protein N0F65_005639 [Lagenidium giganteum]